MVADLDTERARSVVGDTAKVVGDAREIIANPEIDVVIELIGGYGIAKALVLEAIAAGKHVVTANKALLAVHGSEIFKAAAEKGVMVAYEAAVAGGIDRKSTRLNSSHLVISYAVFCLKKKKEDIKTKVDINEVNLPHAVFTLVHHDSGDSAKTKLQHHDNAAIHGPTAHGHVTDPQPI